MTGSIQHLFGKRRNKVIQEAVIFDVLSIMVHD